MSITVVIQLAIDDKIAMYNYKMYACMRNLFGLITI